MGFFRRLRKVWVAPIVAAATVLGSAGPAAANGRFPEANAVFTSEHVPDLVLLRLTFGLMVSHDRGHTWGWVCERSLAIVGVEDPMYAITPSGRIIGSTFQGLIQSADNNCTNTVEKGQLANLIFVDLASRPNDKKSVVAFASTYDSQDDAGAVRFDNRLFETTDEGRTFTILGDRLDPYMLGQTVDYAASDANRIYASVLRNISSGKPEALVLASTDHGKTWTESAIAVTEMERAVYIAAVDPVDANRIYIRTQSAVDKPGRVLLSEDGAKTWRTIFTSKGAVFGFALSSDGKRLWVGGPLDGVQVASTADFRFAQKSKQRVLCLTSAGDGLWACSTERDGFVAGLSKDDGATWEPRLHFCDVKSTIDCPVGTPTRNDCAPAWPTQKALLGCTSDAGLDGGTPPPSPAEAGGGLGGGGCGCTAGTTASVSGGASGTMLVLAFWRWSRRRRRT